MFNWFSSWCHGLFLYFCDSKNSSFLVFLLFLSWNVGFPFVCFPDWKIGFIILSWNWSLIEKWRLSPFLFAQTKETKRKVSKSKITVTGHIPFSVPQATQNYFHRFKWENLAKKCCIFSHSLWGSTTEMWKFLEKHIKLTFF